jgi:hypothetical protein
VRPGLRVEDQPRLGLPEVGAKVFPGEVATRVEVHGEALAGIEQLDQQAGVRAKCGDVLGTEEALRVCVYDVSENSAAGERGQPLSVVPE